MTTFNYKSFIQKLIKDTVTITPIGHHYLKRHLVYKVETKATNYVVKLYFKPNKWNREVSALQYFKDRLNIPKIYSYGILEQQEYLIMEYIDGVTLKESNTNNTKDIYYETGKQVAKMHRFSSFPSFGVLKHDMTFKTEFTSWKDYFMYEANRHLDNLSKWDHPNKELIHLGKSLFLNIVNNLNNNVRPYFTHNDVSDRNIFTKDDTFLTLIDFEQSCVQDRYRELVFIEYHLSKINNEIFNVFLEGYKEIMDFDEETFYKNRDIYILHYGLAICSWSLEVDKTHYQEGIDLIKRYV